MCGIAGIMVFGEKGMPLTDRIKGMCKSMANRGPDDEGYLLMDAEGGELSIWAGGSSHGPVSGTDLPYIPKQVLGQRNGLQKVALGHRRLAILDLSIHGHQPMCNDERRYWIIHNGEIYNFIQIREELESGGYRFHSQTDTEVILKAYEAWGPGCLEKFNGMFAFVILDRQNRTLFMARDRIGIKPLYYHHNGSYFVFASDIKTIIASGLYRPEMDEAGFHHCLSYSIAPRPMTCFKNISAVEQGTWMRIDHLGHTRKGRYWDLDFSSVDQDKNGSKWVSELEDLLTTSVKRRLISDVPVGTFMSGGIDSTTISSIASLQKSNLTAFTLAFDEDIWDLDETKEAIQVAEKYAMDHRIKRVTEADILESLYEMVECYEEPYNSLAPNYVISKVVSRDGIHCILNGIGGDELFAGYRWYLRLNQVLRYRKFLPQGLGRLLLQLPLPRRYDLKYRGYLNSAFKDDLTGLYHYSFSTLNEEEKEDLYTEEFRNRVRDFDSRRVLSDLYGVDKKDFADPYQVFSYLDLMNYIGNHHLYRLDQFTMKFSIEGRFPYLDHEIIEFASRLPASQKIRDGVQKCILRQVAKKYLPPICFKMSKKGFSFPVDIWMRGDLEGVAKEALEKLKKRGIFRGSKIDESYKQFQLNRLDYKKVWILVSCELWFERFIDNF